MENKVAEGVSRYNLTLTGEFQAIAELLASELTANLPGADNKLWHGHPVWFLAGNPIAGYSKQKRGIRLMFWSGADFDEALLASRGEKFKDASIFFNSANEIDFSDLRRWLQKSVVIQWDYKNIVKRKGKLERLK
jgi:hypothetical protein